MEDVWNKDFFYARAGDHYKVIIELNLVCAELIWFYTDICKICLHWNVDMILPHKLLGLVFLTNQPSRIKF